MITLSWTDRLAFVNRRAVIAAALVVIAVAVIAGAVWFWLSAEERRASAAYATAMVRLGSARTRNAPPEARTAAARELEAALASYPSAAMAAQAAFELGSLRFADRQYAQARSAWEVALARAGAPTLRALARAGIGGTWEAERNFANAIQAYQAALSDLKPKEFLYEDTLIDLGRVQELANKKDDAVGTYRRLLKDVPQTRRAEDVRARLASLGATP